MTSFEFVFCYSALNKFHIPVNHRNHHSFETNFHSSTLFTETDNPLSLSAELYLTSLSSDSGILTAKLSDISNSGEFDESPIRQQMEQGSEKYLGDLDDGNKSENGDEKRRLGRTDSVRARANMFQAMEEQLLKKNMDDVHISKCKTCEFFYFLHPLKSSNFRLRFLAKSYISSPTERLADFETENSHRDRGKSILRPCSRWNTVFALF